MVKQRSKNQIIDISNDVNLANPNYLPGKSPPTHIPTSEQLKGTKLVGLKPFPTESTEAASKWYVDNFAAGGGGISTVEDNGAPVASNASIINFGASLVVTNNGGGRITVDSTVGSSPLTGKTFLPLIYDSSIFTKTSVSATTVGTPLIVDSDEVDLTIAGMVPTTATHVQIRAQLIGVAQGNNNISLMVADTLTNAITETNPKLTLKLVKETGESWGSVSDLTWVDDDYVSFIIAFDTTNNVFGYKIVDDRNDVDSLGLSDNITVIFYIEGYWLTEAATVLPPPVISEDLVGAVNSTLIIDGIETSSLAVNHLRIYNANSGQSPVIEAYSLSDADVNLEIKTKGSGLILAKSGYNMTLGPNEAFATKGYVDSIALTGSKYIKINSTGADAFATGTDAIAIGEGSSSSQTNSIAIGQSVTNSTANTVKIGSSNSNFLELSSTGNLKLYNTSNTNINLIADGTNPNINLVLTPKGTGNVSANNTKIINVANPTTPQDAATKSYVDSQIGLLGSGAVIGEIKMYGGSSPPPNYLLCNGAAISRTTYAALFAVIGTTYGVGDSITTFNLPNLLGRVPVGAGAGAGLTNRILGATGGAETHTLTINEMPSHTHSASTNTTGAHTHTGSGSTTDSAGAHTHTVTDDYVGPSNVFNLPDGVTNPHALLTTTKTTSSAGAHTHTISSLTIASNGDHSHTITVLPSGSNQEHNNMQPFTVVNYIIYAGV